MRALSLKGQRVQALAKFENLKKALQRELRVEPSEDTLQLYQQIRDGKSEVQKEIPVEAIPQPPTPFERPRHNLPLQLTSFIGREKEIAEIQALLEQTPGRLVTLTGSGGTGKSRLALRMAENLQDEYEDGIWLVELASLSDSDLVAQTVAINLGLNQTTTAQVTSELQDYLETKHLLLIMDNCEHLVDTCAGLADILLRACPRLFILVSSREALGIAGEIPYHVPPLHIPDIKAVPTIEELRQYEAIQLFIERARSVSPNFTLDAANSEAVLQVCQRLEGIPLAIELAAARVKLLQVGEIAQRLDDRFHLLTGGDRAALPHHQTLRASLDWSYELLSEAEKTFLQRLSVFAGSWSLVAAEAVGSGNGIPVGDVLDLLGQLVDKSLVIAEADTQGETHYRMLETIRRYAHEKMVATGQAEKVSEQHLQYYLVMVERIERKIRGAESRTICNQLEAEIDNLRLALMWSLEERGKPSWSPESGLRLATALWWYWAIQNRFEEGYRWLNRLLTSEDETRGNFPTSQAQSKIRAKALCVSGILAEEIGDINLTFAA
jgi:predicted ATPase